MDVTNHGRMVLLNGVGSVGKSSIAMALQAVTREPFLRVAMDTFLEMIPSRVLASTDGLTFQPGESDGHPLVTISTGPYAAHVLHGMRRAVRAMADDGLNLIVDDVADSDDIQEYRELLAGNGLSVVGVMASLPVLEARERGRGDRVLGLARVQFPTLHKDITYDVVVDTDTQTPEQCAAYLSAELSL
jgi:chloramphenicol 3-O phosphotransferase